MPHVLTPPVSPCCHRDLPRGLQLVGQAINGLAKQAQVDAAGSILHVAVCNGSDALAVSEGAAKLLASGADLLGDMADDSFSSMELIGAEGHSSTATPKQIAQVRGVCIECGMQRGARLL
jgi:hypothetical protein